MRAPFGLLLIGGGIILIVGLFTGKIIFPLGGQPAAAAPATASTGNTAGKSTTPVASKSNAR